jgi:GTP cyclohydrolase I
MDEQPRTVSDWEEDQLFNLATTIRNELGTECWDDSVEDTARRILAFWREYVQPTDLPFEFTVFPTTVNQMIIVRDIEFSSLCAHHLLPFYGIAHVGYLPNKKMVGLSKIPRLVDYHAKRPCTQEALTASIATDLKARLEAMGVAVIIEARHTCMACRGVRKHNGAMITSEMRGVFFAAEAARMEFLNLIGRGRI